MEKIAIIVLVAFTSLIIAYLALKHSAIKRLEDGITIVRGIAADEIKRISEAMLEAPMPALIDDMEYREAIIIRFTKIISHLKLPVDLLHSFDSFPENRQKVIYELFYKACNKCAAEEWVEIYWQHFAYRNENITALRTLIDKIDYPLRTKVMRAAMTKFNDYKVMCLSAYDAEDEVERVNVEIVHIIKVTHEKQPAV